MFRPGSGSTGPRPPYSTPPLIGYYIVRLLALDECYFYSVHVYTLKVKVYILRNAVVSPAGVELISNQFINCSGFFSEENGKI